MLRLPNTPILLWRWLGIYSLDYFSFFYEFPVLIPSEWNTNIVLMNCFESWNRHQCINVIDKKIQTAQISLQKLKQSKEYRALTFYIITDIRHTHCRNVLIKLIEISTMLVCMFLLQECWTRCSAWHTGIAY